MKAMSKTIKDFKDLGKAFGIEQADRGNAHSSKRGVSRTRENRKNLRQTESKDVSNTNQGKDKGEVFFNYFKNKALADISDNELNSYIDNMKEYARFLKNKKFTTTKIRSIYSDIQKCQTPRDIKKLRPKFAYTGGRADNNAVRRFTDLLEELAKQATSSEDVEKIKDFAEGIVAYRKYYGDDK